MGNALGPELARFRKTNTISRCANDGALAKADCQRLIAESLPKCFGCGYAALCRVRARWKSVLLDQQPSLLTLRRQCPVFVRMIPRYYAAVRLLGNVHAGRAALAFARRPAT